MATSFVPSASAAGIASPVDLPPTDSRFDGPGISIYCTFGQGGVQCFVCFSDPSRGSSPLSTGGDSGRGVGVSPFYDPIHNQWGPYVGVFIC